MIHQIYRSLTVISVISEGIINFNYNVSIVWVVIKLLYLLQNIISFYPEQLGTIGLNLS